MRSEIRDLIVLALDATDPDTLTAENLADARHALIEALDIVEAGMIREYFEISAAVHTMLGLAQLAVEIDDLEQALAIEKAD
ncbi:MAG: hypothetical protein Q4G26_15940, partial [Paracoccus sp. (in: a-proteobacteria)]|nr:hypothetical protein [Paracoccus sp. (in: a-proteobacteria)]